MKKILILWNFLTIFLSFNAFFVKTNSTIINFDQLITDAIKTSFAIIRQQRYEPAEVKNIKYQNFQTSDVNISNFSKQPSVINEPQAFFLVHNFFPNFTSETQTFKTNIFQKTFTVTSTTAVTKGISLNLSAKINIFEKSFNFDYSSTTENKTSREIVLKTVGENIVVKPFHAAKVNIFWGKSTSEIDLILDAKISGTINCQVVSNFEETFNIDMATALYLYSTEKALPPEISVDLSNQIINFKGAAFISDAAAHHVFSTEKEIYKMSEEEISSNK